MHYAHGLWKGFGVNLLDQDRLSLHQFLGMCAAVDAWEREAANGQ